MDELQTVVSKLHDLQQQTEKFSEFEHFPTIFQNQQDYIQKKLDLLEAEVENKLRIHKKADINKKQQLKDILSEAEVKKTKKAANDQLICTLREELSHINMEENSLRGALKGEPKEKQLEEEEAMSIRHLGLEIMKVKGGWLQLVFTQINRQKPNSPYCFSLKLDENRKYVVEDCQPKIVDMTTLVERLNTTNNLSTFVHSVRNRFLALVSK